MKTPEDKKIVEARKQVRIEDFGESLTKQSFEPEQNINNIMARFAKTGVLPEGRQDPKYIDCTKLVDFTMLHEATARAKLFFEDLPEEIKNKFANAENFITAASTLSDDELTKVLKLNDKEDKDNESGKMGSNSNCDTVRDNSNPSETIKTPVEPSTSK